MPTNEVVKTDRPETPYQLTRSVCPECLQPIDAELMRRGDRLVLRKWCAEHGWFEALVTEDASRHHAYRRFNKPGTLPLHFERDFHGCPDSCGLCPEHQQHTCLGILEITQACNLSCPVCFAEAKRADRGRHLSLEQITDMMDRLRRCEGDPEVIQLSGGEPTIHPRILDVLRAAREREYRKVLLNTNGLRIAEDPAFVDALQELDPTIYLQFDGFEPETYQRLRGRADLAELKQRVLQILGEREMRVVLVATVVRDVNEHEIGALVDLALETRHVRCLNFQPATYTGRFGGLVRRSEPMRRVTLDEVVRRIAEQSRYGLRADDFFPIPCPDPTCSRVTYIHKEGDVIRPIPRLVEIDEYLDYFENVSSVGLTDQVKGELERLFSMSAVPGEDSTRSFCAACGIDIDWGALELEITMIGMMQFMDRHTFDLQRAKKCCVHEVLPDDGGIVPFCVYNVLRRGK